MISPCAQPFPVGIEPSFIKIQISTLPAKTDRIWKIEEWYVFWSLFKKGLNLNSGKGADSDSGD
jgi:hypothetical protein